MTCTEIDTPQADNTATGLNLPSQVATVRVPVAGPAAGYFQGCIVNYDESNPPVQFSIGIFQA
jgi:hypothetical protein